MTETWAGRYVGRGNLPVFAALAAVLLALGCSGGSGTGPAEEPPNITIGGVADGVQYGAPVTITIAVDRGAWEASLNGTRVTSGFTVAAPGDYELVVTARNGVATRTETVSFSIAGAEGGTLIIRMLDLGPSLGGGGDAILITDSSAAGQVHALIDAGPAGVDGSDAAYVSRRLLQLGVDTLQFLQLSHAHSDHFDGMRDVLSSVTVRRFYYNGQVRNLGFYNTMLSVARARADTVIVVTDSVPIAFGLGTPQSRFTILPPMPTYLGRSTDDGRELNNGSLGTSLRRGDWHMFFTGDGEVEANVRWRTIYPNYTRNVDVLKIGHHGANNAIFDGGFNTSFWLDHTDPAVGLISSNGSSHPRLAALSRIMQQGMDTFCTHVHGEITVRVYGDGTRTVSTERNRNLACSPGSEADS